MVLSDIVERIRGEYLEFEMPGLRLTAAQGQRLWNLEGRACERLFHRLIEDRFLGKNPDGAFARIDTTAPGQEPSAHPTKPEVR